MKTITENRKWLILSSAYVLVVLFIGGYLNYVLPYSGEPETNPPALFILIWSSFYLPIIVLPLVAKKNVSDFGFTLSPQLAIGFFLVTILCTSIININRTSWVGMGIEAFARTGEEIFFRGFLFDLFYQLFSNRRRPWLWAVIASSILFTAVHTQAFQQSYLIAHDYPTRSAFSIVFERYFSVFGLSLVIALLRVATRSILPGAIIHSISASGPFTIPFVLVIYFIGIFWAYKRGEKILSGFTDVKDG